MNRRDLLLAVGAAGISVAAMPARGQEAPRDHPGPIKRQALFDAASKCSKSAEICIGHCDEMRASGDKPLSACAASAREVLVVCNGLRALAAQDSAHLVRYARLAGKICKSCETECRKHVKHRACKDCADACAACAAECGKVV